MHTDIQKHEDSLKFFIDRATRWQINAVFKMRSENNMFPGLDYPVKNVGQFFEDFKESLRKEIDKPENGKAFEIDIKDRFLPMIKHYYKWYEQHRHETKMFEPYNFYEWMYENMVSTEHEINKYYAASTLQGAKSETENSKTKNLIEHQFEKIKESVFTSDDDYNSFLDLLTNFFEYKPYIIPEKKIKLKRDSKTRVASVFNPIHKELSEKTLKSDSDYFKILRVLNVFSKASDIDIYKAITR